MKPQTFDTAAQIKTACITKVSELLQLPGWETFRESKLGNDLFINDPERAERIHDAAADGCDGSTHAEVIEDWREFAADHYRELEHAAFGLDTYGEEWTELDAFITDARAQLDADIDRCEQWHEQHGTLEEQIG